MQVDNSMAVENIEMLVSKIKRNPLREHLEKCDNQIGEETSDRECK
jgi:hypothetical protein